MLNPAGLRAWVLQSLGLYWVHKLSFEVTREEKSIDLHVTLGSVKEQDTSTGFKAGTPEPSSTVWD